MDLEKVLSVTELSHLISQTLEYQLPLFRVEGEISQITKASSGHYYFSIKDEFSAMNAVMFRGRAMALDFQPKQGDMVELKGKLSLFAARGSLQIQVDEMRRAGLGTLFERYLQILEKLKKEGLFDEDRKLAIPAYPRRVGIITSLQAAALHDVLTALRRRAPQFQVTIYPSLVQGAEAVDALMRALTQAELRQEVDVILLVRGGGSLEDLWCFNDERLARMIAACTIPIVSGVGHETDVTIADYVADLRAATPTAAAELISKAAYTLPAILKDYHQRIGRVMLQLLAERQARFDELQPRLNRHMERILLDKSLRYDELQQRLVAPQRLLTQYDAQRLQMQQALQRQWLNLFTNKHKLLEGLCLRLASRKPNIEVECDRLSQWQERLHRAVAQQLKTHQQVFEQQRQLLHNMNPKQVLQRGFSIVYDAEGQVVRDADQLRVDDELQLEFASGRAAVHVKSLNFKEQ
ncbi:exodeoxyribonuclease VII large subunit [Oligella urethralis]|uniref:Exodeoxyribonuclease 7 large subunit n=1 Tax=Oligella urethralis TaxID=90245 RepID=A0A2X1UIL7_9BURK|nr:exodeoxyribonuclease VII large subunit [Oligella urethralis]SPY07062.1 Exodeoxyribonuclease 7 large subunit [Oligella urethralis]